MGEELELSHEETHRMGEKLDGRVQTEDHN